MWKKGMGQLLARGYYDLRVRTAAAAVFALAWWGVLYPELFFTESVFEQIIVSDGREVVSEQADYRDILGASGDEIVVKSRLLEWLEQHFHTEQIE